MAKRIIILKHNGGRFANQLFLYATVLAYCFDKKYECINYPFYSFRKYFVTSKNDFLSRSLDLLGYLPLEKKHKYHYIFYTLYKFLVPIIKLCQRGDNLVTKDDETFLLPPSKNENPAQRNMLGKIESSKEKNCYFEGWGFKNPKGLVKYRSQIVNYLKFKNIYTKDVNKILNKFKGYYLVGVHIRQGDFSTFAGGKYRLDEKRANRILEKHKNKFKSKAGSRKIKYVIFSDQEIDTTKFFNKDLVKGPGEMVRDFILLSKCDIIVGSSTYSEFASYYGNVPYLSFHGYQLNKFLTLN